MQSDEQLEIEPKIVIRAVYIGKGPCLSSPKEPLFIGGIPLIEPITKGVPANRLVSYGKPFPNVEFLQGSLEYDREEERTGIAEGSVLVIYDVTIKQADSLMDLEFWRFERLSWSKYREIISAKYEKISRLRDGLADRLTNGWFRFLGLHPDQKVPKVVRIDAWFGKHPKDLNYPNTNVIHYHVNLRSPKVADVLNAIEYIEQAFYSIGVDCKVSLSLDAIEVYVTPKGLADETKE